jgi:DNA-binding MarR family transcriptional regulator
MERDDERLKMLMAARKGFGIRLFARLADHYRDRNTKAIQEAGFPDYVHAHTQVLFNLELEGSRVTTIAERARVTPQAIGKQIRDLEAKGYVERRRDPDDGRAQLISLTEKGLRFFEAAVEIIEAHEREMAEIIGPLEYALMRERVRTIVQKVDPQGF